MGLFSVTSFYTSGKRLKHSSASAKEVSQAGAYAPNPNLEGASEQALSYRTTTRSRGCRRRSREKASNVQIFYESLSFSLSRFSSVPSMPFLYIPLSSLSRSASSSSSSSSPPSISFFFAFPLLGWSVPRCKKEQRR